MVRAAFSFRRMGSNKVRISPYKRACGITSFNRSATQKLALDFPKHELTGASERAQHAVVAL
jgi:hypothetical protein